MVLSSCEDKEPYDIGGELTRFAIDATLDFGEDASRSVLTSAQEQNFTKYCFLYFEGKTSDSKLLYKVDIDASEMPYYTMMPSPGEGKTNAAILLGNVSLSQLGTVNTLGDLVNKVTIIDYKYYNPQNNSQFTWSGYIGVTRASNSLNFVVNPNLAKMSVTIKNNQSAVTLKNVRIKKVPTKVGYAQSALNAAGITTEISSQTYIDYYMENINISNGGTYTNSWYMPQNMRGTVSNGRNGATPPSNATYLELDALSSSHTTPIATAYKIYPGVNKNNTAYASLNDFNVQAGYNYNLNVTVAKDGISGSVGNGFSTTAPNASALVKLPKGTNCYMIHPEGDKVTSGKGVVYELPIDRVNQYWKDVKNNSSYYLTVDDEWQMEVIWQDMNHRAIYFCDVDGNSTSDTYVGKGLAPAYFKYDPTTMVPTDATTRDIYGNILVGLKRKGQSSYLWSWHLWVTDYNPDAAISQTEAANTNSYNVNSLVMVTGTRNIDLQGYLVDKPTGVVREMGGNVQHYSHTFSAYWGTAASPSASAKVWDQTLYKGKWIMDRQLGSLSPSGMDDPHDPTTAYGMYYQFGRKDPFPYAISSTQSIGRQLYKINGEDKVTWTYSVGSQKSMNDAVLNPNTFYGVENADWADASSRSANVWNSPTDIGEGGKSLFDPCPAGWKVPVYEAFDFMAYDPNSIANKTKIYGTTSSTYETERPTLLTYISQNTSGIEAQRNSAILTYMSDKGGSSNRRAVWAVYTFQGSITSTSGISNSYSTSFMWSAKQYDANRADGLSFRKDNGSTLTLAKQYKTQTVTKLNDYLTDDVEVRNGRSYDIYNGRFMRDAYYKSRGHSVRCIQE